MNFLDVFVATFAILATPASPQIISLHPGETVTIRFVDDQPQIEQTEPAQPMSKYDLYVLWRAETQDIPAETKVMPPAFITKDEGPSDSTRPVPSLIQLTMRRVPGPTAESPQNTALFISNGYGSTFAYHAVMSRDGRPKPTDVCEVPPKFPGLEQWPYPIDQLDLSDLRLVQTNGQIDCQ
ncbi:MAG: hypothetical protein HOP95_07790 [Sphingomonas sp.]|nr:hypothetical protein [Sphingomonas sp.]